MKNALIALVAFAAIGLASCSKTDSPLASNASANDEMSSLVISTTPPFDQYAALTSFDGVTYSTDGPEHAALDDKRPQGRHDDKKNLGAILRCMELTADQRTQVEGFMKAARECMATAEAPFRDAVKALREEHRAKVKEIRDAVKAGTMTKEDARTALRDLEKALRTALEENRASMMAAAKLCEDSLFASIEGILTPDQLVKWNEWKATGKVPCTGTGGVRG